MEGDDEMTTLARDLFLGRTSEGEKFYVSVEIEDGDREHETVTHGRATVQRLSIQGVLIRKGGSFNRDGDWISSGQCRDSLANVTQPVEGWTRTDIKRLHAIWNRWHLNDMKAGCAHQAVVWEDKPYRRPSLELTEPCPITGYRYGHAWLAEELPTDVVEWLTTRFATTKETA